MTLKDANYEVERLTNDLNKLINDKLILESLVVPKSADYEKVIVDGGKHCNMIEIYILKQDVDKWKDLDLKIKRKQSEINNYINWINEELKILKKYNKVEQLIVYYKEESPIKYKWYEIAKMEGINYSIPQCKRIYSLYKQKRNIH